MNRELRKMRLGSIVKNKDENVSGEKNNLEKKVEEIGTLVHGEISKEVEVKEVKEVKEKSVEKEKKIDLFDLFQEDTVEKNEVEKEENDVFGDMFGADNESVRGKNTMELDKEIGIEYSDTPEEFDSMSE